MINYITQRSILMFNYLHKFKFTVSNLITKSQEIILSKIYSLHFSAFYFFSILYFSDSYKFKATYNNLIYFFEVKLKKLGATCILVWYTCTTTERQERFFVLLLLLLLFCFLFLDWIWFPRINIRVQNVPVFKRTDPFWIMLQGI